MDNLWHQIWTIAFGIGIFGNLVASAIWAIPAFIHLHRKIDRHHKEHLDAFRLGYHPNVSADGSIGPSTSPNVPPSDKMD